MKKFLKLLSEARWPLAAILLVGLVMISSCKKDDPDPDPDNPIASFQFEVSADNFLMVVFTNYSQYATSYSWDFGDGNTSTEENPTHTYAEAGTYTVSLTATGEEGTTASTKSETIEINDPNAQLTLLAGADSKKWYLDRQGVALGIGPEMNNNTWWSFGGVTPLGDRPCILDDYYEFHRDGTFTLHSDGTVFVDAWGNGGWLDTESCVDQSESGKLVGGGGEDLSIYATGGDFSFEYDPVNNLITLLGEGTYIGLPNKTNGGDNYVPIASKEYTIFNFVDGDGVDSLHMALLGDGFSWNFYLVHYENEADLPDIPTAFPSAGFSFTKDGFEVTFKNTSKNCTSYMWDFGDGGSSTEENPVHTFAGAGEYQVTLTGMDDNGNSDTNTQTVTLTADVFTAAVLSSDAGKVWKLIGDQSLKVGDSKGSGVWWTIDAATAEARACLMDDEFIFFNNADFTYDTKGELWAETYLGVAADGCIADADLQSPYDVFGSNTFTFEVTEASGDQAAKIKVIGTGAFIGFNKAYNGGELNFANGVQPAAEIEYEVFDYYTTADKEFLSVTVDISADLSGTAWWTFTLESLK